MLFALIVSSVLWAITIRLALKHLFSFWTTKPTRNRLPHQVVKKLAACNEPGARLAELIETEGAGSWPPRAVHDNWPADLQPYQQIWDEMAPLLPSENPCLDAQLSRHNVDRFRSLMCEKLQSRIQIQRVEEIMVQVANGDHSAFPRDAYNGFYGCIALCRHAYRWASIPIVKAAQSDTMIDFPTELETPWVYLQKHFGISADSGNNTSNVLCNYSINNERRYKFTTGVSDEITSSEENFFHIFLDLETSALPIYHDMIYAIRAFQMSNTKLCATHLRKISTGLRDLLQIYYRNMRNSKVGTKVWMRWIQGFQGWAAGRMIDGHFVKFNGISASQVLFFQSIDAFLGMESFLSDIDNERYIPIKQRQFVAALKKCSFRRRIDDRTGPESAELAAEFAKVVNQVKAFRAAHRTRCMPYLKEPAPERMPMTAGMFQPTGNGEYSTKGNYDAFEPLLDLLTSRLRATK